MKTFALSLLLLAFLTGTAFAGPKKTAFIFVNWGAPAFVSEAKATEAALIKRGWITYLFESVESDGLTIKFNADGREQTYACVEKTLCGWQTIVKHFLPLDSIQNGERVLLDIQGDGTTVLAADLKLDDGTSLGIAGIGKDIDSALAYEEFSKTFKYPSDSVDVWGTHSIEAYFNNMKKNTTTGSEYLDQKYGTYFLNMISTGDLNALAKAYSDKKAQVTVIDHSCQAGATTMMIEKLGDSNICAVSTTGIDSPAIQGTPALSAFLALPTFENLPPTPQEYASWVSFTFQDQSNFYATGNRIHQAGFVNGCTKTMAVRETSDNATGAYGTWWDWSRSRPSHVLRNPERYATPATASAEPVWSADQLDSSFANDCKAKHKNCDLKTNPRVHIADGWVRWFEESLADFASKQSPSAELNKLKSDGQELVSKIKEYGSAVDDLDTALTNPQNTTDGPGGAGGSVDYYLRHVFMQHCLCPNKDAVKRLKLICSDKPSDDFNLLPAWSDASVCSNPAGYVNVIISMIPERVDAHLHVIAKRMDVTLRRIQSFESGELSALLIQFSKDLMTFEQSCTNETCKKQSF